MKDYDHDRDLFGDLVLTAVIVLFLFAFIGVLVWWWLA
jgi:hypothetical protein